MSTGSNLADGLLEIWLKASQDLGLRIQAPFRLVMRTGVTVAARLHLSDFGAVNGMLIFTNYSDLRPHAEEVVAAGYGYSTLSEPSQGEHYDRARFVEMLQDWGWSGPEHLRPGWCQVHQTRVDD